MASQGYEELYLHLPFCRRRCAYCDFTTSAIDPASPAIDAYVDALGLYIRKFGREGFLGDIGTVYLGGGTPSFVGSARLSRLLYLLSVSMDIDPDVEFTMEMNPDSCDRRLLKDLRALGVTRISLGVQSLDDDVLMILGRLHDADAARRAITEVLDLGLDLSVDLMCGIPGQTRESWIRTLDEIISLHIPHVSVYPLSVEQGTQVAARIETGSLEDIDEDMQADMMLDAQERLQAAGLMRYEVASYALAGYECRHNIGYWSGASYLGLGLGASSYQSRDLFDRVVEKGMFLPHGGIVPADSVTVRSDMTEDRDVFIRGLPQPVEVDPSGIRRTVCEQVMLRMRMVYGFEDAELAAVEPIAPGMRSVFLDLAYKGLLQHEGPTWKLTERGWLMGNIVFGHIWSLAEG